MKEGIPTKEAFFQATLQNLRPEEAVAFCNEVIELATHHKGAMLAQMDNRQAFEVAKAAVGSDMTERGTLRKYRPYGVEQYARLSVDIPKDMKASFVKQVKQDESTQAVVVSYLIDKYLKNRI